MSRLFFLLIILLVSSCNSSEDNFDTGSYEKARESLEKKEKKHPEQFIVATGSNRRNLIGQTVVRGSITNRASVCTYKDVQLKISYYSKTGVLLEESSETVYEVLGPNSTQKFKTKEFAPKGADSVSITVVGAKVQ